MRYFLLAPLLLAAVVSVAQLSAQPNSNSQSSTPGHRDSDTCLICKRCPTSLEDSQSSAACLLCQACSAQVENQQVDQPTTPVTTTKVVAKDEAPREWRTYSGALDLHFESGAVFNGPTLAVCDISSFECSDSGKTHIAGKLGATYWMTPTLGLSLDTVLMDGGSIAGISENSVGAYLGLQLQKPNGAVRPYLEFAPGYIHSFTTGNSGAVQFNPDLASVKAGGGIRFVVRRNWGIKLGVNALPSFSGLGHQTPVIVTAGWFWQSKGKSHGE